jgi:hypothetical protein
MAARLFRRGTSFEGLIGLLSGNQRNIVLDAGTARTYGGRYARETPAAQATIKIESGRTRRDHPM